MDRKPTTQTLFAVAQALLLLVAPVAAAAPATAPQSASQSSLPDDVEPADAIYVMENGDAVLAYNGSGTGSTTATYGANVTAGLVHMLVTDDVESNVTAAASLVMTPDGFTGNGSITAERPPSLKRLSLDATGEQNAKTAKADLTLDAAFDSRSAGTSAFETASTNGHVTITADSLSTKGEAVVAATSSMGSESELRYDLRETEDGYVLKGSRSGTVSFYMSDYWSTREAAKSYLRTQYAGIAEQYGGSATVTISQYDYREKDGRPTLDIEYAVEYSGLEAAITRSLVAGLKGSQDISLSDEEIDALAEDVKALKVDHVTFEMTQRPNEVRVNWDAKIENYDEAASAAITVAQSMNGEASVDQQSVEQVKTAFEAQQAANLKQTVEWSGEMTRPSSRTTAVTAEIHYRTKNWDAYVTEMERRGVELGSSSFEFHAKSNGGDVTAEASVELKQKELLSKMTDAVVSSLDPETDAEALKVLRAFERSEFRTARVDMNVDQGTVTVEGGAKFDNLSALSTALGDSYGGLNVASVAGRSNDGETTTYARVEGLVGEDATEEDVRALAVADSETTIHLPGEWDREFPSMETGNVSAYLGVERENATGTNSESKSGGQPGFGVAAALVALAGVALPARRD